jgi:hypothetical protein
VPPLDERWLVLSIALMLLAAPLLGYFLGKDGAPTERDAQAERRSATHKAYRASFLAHLATSRQQGRGAGLRTGRRRGRRSGTEAGETAGRNSAEHVIAELQPPEPAPGTAGASVCVKYQDYVPGVGCVPPVAPGETEAPINCPPGQVPVGTTGACAEP